MQALLRTGITVLAVVAGPACTGDGGSRPGPDGGAEVDGGIARDSAPPGAEDASAGSDAGGASDGGGDVPCAFAERSATGIACAIAPSATEDGILDDFGHHAVAVPAEVTRDTGVYVHLVGTRGKPARAETQRFPNLPTLVEGAEAGHIVLMLAYPNRTTIGSLCGADLDCYEPVRLEVLRGLDAPAPYGRLIDVAPPNDVQSRLRALVGWLLASGLLGPSPPGALDGGEVLWSSARIGGHSQGGGHAAVLAKHRMVERVCMLSSPCDGTSAADAVTYAGAPGWATPLEARRGAVHEEDRCFEKARANYVAMGLTLDREYRILSDSTSDPHAFPVKSESASAVAARAWACFER